MRTLFILFFLLSAAAKAQTIYNVNQIPFYHYPSGGDTMQIMNDDKFMSAIPIGFSFNFFGNTYDSIVFSTNGMISFNMNNAGLASNWYTSMSVLPIPVSDFNNSILFPHSDLDFTTGITTPIYYRVEGVAPFRKFILGYDTIPLFSCNSLKASAQVVLHEGSNVIDINIKEKPLCSSWNAGWGLLGIQDSNGLIAYAPSNRNGGSWLAFQESWRFVPSSSWPVNTGSCKIKGNVYFDMNSNCTNDAGDTPIPYITLQSNNWSSIAYTQANGDYELLVDTGTHTIIKSTWNGLNNFCPAQATTVVLNNPGDSVINVNFADTGLVYQDLWVYTGMSTSRFCDSNPSYIVCGNNGTAPAYGITLTHNIPSYSLVSNFSQAPSSSSANQLTFLIDTLLPYQTITITYIDSILCNPNYSGTIHCLNTNISNNVVETNNTNNTASFCSVITNSYDPNNVMSVSSGANPAFYTENGLFEPGNTIDYIVNFQNTGNANALDIIVVVDLDTNLLIPSSFNNQLGSHSNFYYRENNKLKIFFPNINLPDSNVNEKESHGWFRFSMKTPSWVPNPTTISTKASIYFDNNPPVLTKKNKQTYLVAPLSIKETTTPQDLVLVPNPSYESCNISWVNLNDPIELLVTNTFGQIVLREKIIGTAQFTWNTKDVPTGVYYINLISNTGINKPSKLLVIH